MGSEMCIRDSMQKVEALTAEVAALKEEIPNVPTIVTPEGVIQDPNLEYLVVRSNEATGDGSPTIKSMLDAGIVVRLESKVDES